MLGAKGSLTADPNPIHVLPGTALGETTLSWNSEGTTTVEVHVGAPDGPLLSRTGRSGKAATGEWVTDGTVVYLQNTSGSLPLTSENTLAKIVIAVIAIEESLPPNPHSKHSCKLVLSVYPLPLIPYAHDAS